MKPSPTLVIMSLLIALLAALAAGAGVFDQGQGASYEFVSLRGETVAIQGHGLYRYEPVALAAQAIPQDVVTLVVAIPLLLFATWRYRRGSLRGQLLVAGALGYFLYTYTSMAFGAAYNELFLLYVALFSLSLYAFILAMVTIDLALLPAHFDTRLPRRWIAGFLFFGAGFLLLAWLGRIVPPLLAGTPPVGLFTNTTLYIQVMDLGILVPLMLLAGVQLLRRRPLGYLLGSVAMIKFATFGLALVAMIVGQWLAGVPMAVAEVVIFPTLALAAIVLAALLLRGVHEDAVAPG